MTESKVIEPKLMFEPTQWLERGIQLDAAGGLPLFRFTETLQARSDALLALSKSRALSTEEQAELDGLSQLSQIFTYANSLLAANALWSLPPSENSLYAATAEVKGARPSGLCAGEFEVPEDFDASLPDKILSLFES